MLKKLRQKIILINMIFVNVVLLVSITVISFSSYSASVNAVNRELQMLADEAVEQLYYPNPTAPEQPLHHWSKMPYTTVLQRHNGSVLLLAAEGMKMTGPELESAIADAVSDRRPMEVIQDRNLAFLKAPSPWGQIIVFRDVSIIQHSIDLTVASIVALFLVFSVLCFFISWLLASLAVKPVSAAVEGQKQFIANASHDLKTPLTVLLADTNIIASHQDETVAQQQKWLRSMNEEGEKMQSLINAMLTLAKTDNSRLKVQLTPICISDLIMESTLFLESVAFEKQVTLETDIEPHITWYSNRELLQKLVELLVDNAIKYADPGSAVTITLTLGRGPVLSVRNFGPPIPEEDLPHLFERFYRSDKSRSTSGYGLGLAIAKLTSQQLRGAISVTSDEKTGTIFTVRFGS